MTVLTTFMRNAHLNVVDLKKRTIADGEDVTPFTVYGHLAGPPKMMFHCRGRDEMLSAVRSAFGIFGCDLVATASDSYALHPPALAAGADPRVNPDTGRTWEPGDMGRAFQQKRPWVRENIITCGMDKASQGLGVLTQQYTVTGRSMRWHKLVGPAVMGEDHELELDGLMIESLLQSMAVPDALTALDGMRPEGMDRTEARFVGDLAGLTLCMEHEVSVSYFARSMEHAERIAARFPNNELITLVVEDRR